MYLSFECILFATKRLKVIHPFVGITFLSCKKNGLPVGSSIEYSMDNYTKAFMEENQKISDSEYYFHPFKTNTTSKFWVKSNYPSTGLQSVNTRTFQKCFIHKRGSKIWGWSNAYIRSIAEIEIDNKAKISLIDLAIWTMKYKKWKKNTTLEDVLDQFIRDYNITKEEQEILFSDDIEQYVDIEIFHNEQFNIGNFINSFQPAPDAKPEHEGTLSYLELTNVGPTDKLQLHLASRVNIITGDNGLGKTFLMDCSWWALTGTWAESEARPKYMDKQAKIGFVIAGKSSNGEKTIIDYDFKNLVWKRNTKQPTIPGLIVYARVDGSYAVWDPSRHYGSNLNTITTFSGLQVWNGLDGSIEGLIRDWVRWQSAPLKYPFEIFIKVLEILSPPDMGILKPGEPIRVPGDTREIPTIIHPYGVVPITNSSAGIKRIITLAYLVVWAWHEHKVMAEFRRIKPDSRIVIMIDEIEAHLHPKWQRDILPALMEVQNILSSQLEIQFVLSTHSPLVLASAETFFKEDVDKLFHMKLSTVEQNALLEEMDFIRYGQVNSWLTSPIFNLQHARSKEAEVAIEEAKKLQLADNPLQCDVEKVHMKLLKSLAQSDSFWPRWTYFAEEHGVKI